MSPTKDELYELYFNQRLPKKEVAKQCHIAPKTLDKLFKKYGLQYRPIGTNQGHTWTYDEVEKLFCNEGYKLLTNEYINCNTPLKFVCDCGHESEIRLGSFLSGRRCKICGYDKTSSKRRFTIEQVREKFAERGAVLLSTEYKNSSTPLEYICPNCGEVAKMSLSNFQRGYDCSNCKRLRFLGEKNPHYNPNLSDFDRKELGRYEERYKAFRNAVFARDKKCVVCGSTNKKVVHHLDGYANNPDKRTDVNNAVTLCECCHKEFHRIYGYGNNTKEQFKEFKEEKLK